jgi:hypothetical protein
VKGIALWILYFVLLSAVSQVFLLLLMAVMAL